MLISQSLPDAPPTNAPLSGDPLAAARSIQPTPNAVASRRLHRKLKFDRGERKILAIACPREACPRA
jgi:hypothetical protein